MPAQTRQMHALPCAASGTPASSNGGNGTRVHQHGGCSTPLVRAVSMAHWLGASHNGQRPGSIEVADAGRTGICIKE